MPRLKKEQRQSSTPAYIDWREWVQEIAPGHFHAPEDQIDTVRAWLLARGRAPKVLMKDEHRTKTLLLHLTRAEGGGICHIHGVPEEDEHICA